MGCAANFLPIPAHLSEGKNAGTFMFEKTDQLLEQKFPLIVIDTVMIGEQHCL